MAGIINPFMASGDGYNPYSSANTLGLSSAQRNRAQTILRWLNLGYKPSAADLELLRQAGYTDVASRYSKQTSTKKPSGTSSTSSVAAQRQQLLDEYRQSEQEARQANEQRYQDILQGYTDMTGASAERYDTMAENIDNRYDAALKELLALSGQAREQLGGEFQQQRGETDEAYQKRLDTMMNTLKGAGRQEARDINQASKESLEAQKARLRRQGIGNTTVGETMRLGVGRERNDALGRLNERLLNQQLATYAQGSGERLAALQGLDAQRLSTLASLYGQELGAAAGLRGQGLSGAQAIQAARNQTQDQLAQNRLNFMERKTDEYPDLSTLIQLMNAQGQGAGGQGYTGAPARTLTFTYNGAIPQMGSGYGYGNYGANNLQAQLNYQAQQALALNPNLRMYPAGPINGVY